MGTWMTSRDRCPLTIFSQCPFIGLPYVIIYFFMINFDKSAWAIEYGHSLFRSSGFKKSVMHSALAGQHVRCVVVE